MKTIRCPRCNKKLKWNFYENIWECIKGPKDRKEGCGYIYSPDPNSKPKELSFSKEESKSAFSRKQQSS